MPELSKRLLNAAGYVRKGSSVADIGTDHAYLPVYLILNNLADKALACDLRKGPLFNAKKTINEFGLGNKIELRLSDGLDNISPNEVNDIIICGMGGTLISQILTRAEWLKCEDYRLILQPQSHSYEVRYYLINNGFEILNESVIKEEGFIYNEMLAQYTGKIKEYDEKYIWFGSIIDNEDDVSKSISRKTLNYLKVRYEAENKFGNPEKADEFKRIIKEAEKIL